MAAASSLSASSSMDVEALTMSIKVQTEQNQLLRRVFNELEKELRSLTDNRIALEIKLDILNTAATTAAAAAAAVPAATIQTASNNNTIPNNNNLNLKKQIQTTPITAISGVTQPTNILATSSNLIASNALQVTPIVVNNNSNNANLSTPITNKNNTTPATVIANISVHNKINI
jgi:hypothetical protein